MSKVQKITLAIAALVIIAMLVVAGVSGGAMNEVACIDCHSTGLIDGEACETCGETGMVRGNFWALIPPVIAIGLALITKEVYSSLFIGIVSGALLYTNFNPITTIDAALTDALIPAVSDTAGIFIFLVELGILVAMINRAGGSAAFGKWAQTHIKTRVGAIIATFILGVLIFIDDYFNCLTVGSVMRPVTDAHKISRAKLAYIIDATAAPICMIAPISSWAAAVSQYAEDGKVAMRNVRRDGMDYIKKLKKNSEITEDEQKKAEKDLQDLLDKYIKKVDEANAAKEKELMAI